MDKRDKPQFASLEEEKQYWENLCNEYQKKYIEVKEELDEFQINSRELEAELETQLEQFENKNKELLSANIKLQNECEILREKLDKSQFEKHEQIGELQEELSHIKSMKDELTKYIRELEQTNDDLERAKRAMLVSLEEFEGRLNQAIERNAFLESELDEKEALSTTVQRLKDEARDLRYELQVHGRQPLPTIEPDNDRACEKQSRGQIDSNKLSVEMEDQSGTPIRVSTNQPNLNTPMTPMTPMARISALNIVGDLLRKVGALESKLASCRNSVKDTPPSRIHSSKSSPHNSPRAKRVNRGDSSCSLHDSLKHPK
ncbi:NADH:ubiquinone oxidoreductase [Chamberlinius hualienensis]